MSRNITRRSTALVAALTLSLLAVVSPAFAGSTTVTDKKGDGSSGAPPGHGPRIYGDLGAVRIKHTRDVVRLKVLPARHGQLADFYDFWIDTDPANPGPEYVSTISTEVPKRTDVSHTEGFDDFTGKKTCGGLDGHLRLGAKTVALTIPRHCLGEPSSLRVSTHSAMEYGSADWAPGRHRFSSWVASGPG